jgi:hypothetical protein
MKAALPQAADADRHHHRRAARRAGGAFLGFLGLVADVEEAGWLAVIGVLGGAGAGGLLGGVVGSACASVSRRHASAATASPDSHATAGISSSATNAGSARAPSRRPSPPAMVVSSTSVTRSAPAFQATLGPALAVTLDLRRTAVGTFDMDLPGHYWTITVGASRRW